MDQERRPISLCIILDSSTSMEGLRQTIASALVQATLDQLHPDDEVALVVFAADIKIAIPWTLASEGPRVDWVTYQLEHGTVLIDAVKAALNLVNTARHQRTVILAVSDGEALDSRIQLRDVIRTRRQSVTLVYAFKPEAPGPPQRRGGPPLSGVGSGAGSRAFDSGLVPSQLPDLVGDSRRCGAAGAKAQCRARGHCRPARRTALSLHDWLRAHSS